MSIGDYFYSLIVWIPKVIPIDIVVAELLILARNFKKNEISHQNCIKYDLS